MSTSKIKARSPDTVKAGKFKCVLFGEPGVGKTWSALQFPKVVLFDTEGGATGSQYMKLLKESNGLYLGIEDGSLSFDFLLDQVAALSTEKHDRRTLVIDSITKIFTNCVALEMERLGDKDQFGASKKKAVSYMRRLLMALSRINMNVIIIAHSETVWGLVNGQRAEVGKGPSIHTAATYDLDLVLHAQKRGPQRVVSVTKSRLLGFPDGDTFPLSYDDLAARFGKEAIESEGEVVVMATPAQVSEVKALLEVVKVSEADLQKGFDKAGVTEFAEMTGVQIEGWLTFLKKKIST